MSLNIFKNMSKRKLIIIGLSVLVVLVIIISCIVGSSLSVKKDENGEVIKLLDFSSEDYNYKIIINAGIKKNKIKQYKVIMTKSEEEIYQNTIEREDKKTVYELDVKEIILEKGYGSYEILMEYKDGLFKKTDTYTFIIDDVPGIKNMSVKEDHENQSYVVTVDKVPESIGYRAILSKDGQVRKVEIKDVEDAETYDINLSEAVVELGIGKYELQVENLISEQVTGMPKFGTFVVKKYVDKPTVKLNTTSVGNKILQITKEELVTSYKVEIYKGGKYIHGINDAEAETDLTKIIREKGYEEGTYQVKVTPIIENKEFYLVDTLNSKSVAELNAVEIVFDKVAVGSIGGADLPVINRPWIVISNIDSTKYKYYVSVKSESITKDYEYIEENSNVLTYDDVRLSGGRYFLTKEEVEKIKVGETIAITVYKEDKVNKEKSYEVVYKMEKKTVDAMIKIDTLQLVN